MANADARRIEFKSDYLGRRVQKTVRDGWNGSTFATVVSDEKFVYDGWNCIAKLNASSLSLIASYFWGLDWSGTLQGAGGVGGLALTVEGGNTYLPMFDGNGNVMGMIKASDGSLAAAYEYDAFGNTLRESGPYAASNPFRFSTKYTDLETGLVYYGLRYYAPWLGRFLCRDPKEEDGGRNLYAFLSNQTPNRWDYLGLSWDSDNGDSYLDQIDRANMGDQGSAWEPHQWMGDTMTVVVTGRRSDGTPLPRGTTLDEIRQANHLDENGDSTRPDFRGTTGINGVGSADALALPKFVVSSANSNNLAAVLRVLGSNPIGDSFWRAMQDHDRTQAVRNAPNNATPATETTTNWSKAIVGTTNVVRSGVKIVGGVKQIAAGVPVVIAGHTTGTVTPWSLVAEAGGYVLIANGAKDVFGGAFLAKRGITQLGEARNADTSWEWQNFAGLLPFGGHYDDPGEATRAMEKIKEMPWWEKLGEVFTGP